MTASLAAPGVLDRERALVRARLLEASTAARAEGMPGTEARGQLIRPLAAYAGAGGGSLPEGFWFGVLAVQLAHEASLVHDDIVDAAGTRRGEPTAVAAEGVARALVRGDHLLTAAYRMAARTGSLPFAELFARAVERTVAGEAAQGRAAGEVLDRARYQQVALGKAGELLGCALAVAPVLEGRADADALFELGRRVGLLYQMLDDLLDYCPAAETGKPPLGDYAQGRWTWLLEELPGVGFGMHPEEVRAALHAPVAGGSAMLRALLRLEEEAAELRDVLAGHLAGDRILPALVDGWMGRAREAVARESAGHAPVGPPAMVRSPSRAIRERVPGLRGVEGYLAEHSRSFRFAVRFFPREDAERVARVYAFCRLTDDLVDRPPEGGREAREEILDEWVELSRRGYQGHPTGLPLLDRVMGEMASGGVPFACAAELAEGMRMDLRGERYASLADLRRYTYRVASVVGLWLTRLFGVHDPQVLERAARMGHAMQLTNILRDVGEDRARGRLYLPAELMLRHGVDEEELDRMRRGRGEVGPAYRALVEELMGVAEADYRAALAAVPALPPAFGRPVAVAAHVYRGIHREIRRRGYDNLRQRAYTPPLAKAALAARALWELRCARGDAPAALLEAAPTLGAPRA